MNDKKLNQTNRNKNDQKQANMEGKLNISLKDKNCITNKQIKQDKCKKAQKCRKNGKKKRE